MRNATRQRRDPPGARLARGGSPGATPTAEKDGRGRSLGEAVVVDDDPVTLWILKKALTRIGYRVTTATRASDCRRAAANRGMRMLC